jgi:mono/diheme cytochrome c family protein
MKRALFRGLAAVLAIGALLIALIAWLNQRGEDPLVADAAASASAEQIARGAYLARAGNCMGCHTERGGALYAGGRGVPTPFGTVFAPNLTPDKTSGLGEWTTAQFWRALHNGRSRDGRLLYPAFPYPNYTRVTRADSDAIFAYLRSLPAVAQTNRAHTLSFPFDQQAALAVWRALYFRPAQSEVDASRSADWNRGAYLVEGLGHCNACHASRNALGASASTLDLAGGLIPVQNWYAPSLASRQEAGMADWELGQIVELLKTGVATGRAMVSISGPMSEVVGGSTQYLSDADLRAMAVYLQSLPQTPVDPAATSASAVAEAASAARARAAANRNGASLYDRHCAACHGDQGEGVAGAYPALAGSRAVAMETPANLVHLVLEGGFPPVTGGNPRPYGMPPFATVLSSEEVAQLLSYLRSSWGNTADPVSALEVTRFRRASAR